MVLPLVMALFTIEQNSTPGEFGVHLGLRLPDCPDGLILKQLPHLGVLWLDCDPAAWSLCVGQVQSGILSFMLVLDTCFYYLPYRKWPSPL